MPVYGSSERDRPVSQGALEKYAFGSARSSAEPFGATTIPPYGIQPGAPGGKLVRLGSDKGIKGD
ncbi:MAG: hypothetical protein CBC35_06165 [Planctomycetes bacterium TMED75]|nr:hypothetical protein [Planctomycetaceae bacterium]OUU93144.1 MAG: hypothetical protein CBC35_06165 [Planctomycetes bacterium TMED75]